jgi:hypothetical protein
MTGATFTISPVTEMGTGGTRLVVGCPHRTTTLVSVAAGTQIPETNLSRLALVRRVAAEACACTAALWQWCAAVQVRAR